MPTKPLTPVEWYLRGHSLKKTAKRFRMNHQTLHKLIVAAGHEIRPRAEASLLASTKLVTCELCGHTGKKSTFSSGRTHVVCMTCIRREYESNERGCRKCRTWKAMENFRGDRRTCIPCQAESCRENRRKVKARNERLAEIDRIMIREKAWAILRGRDETDKAKAWAARAIRMYGLPDHAGISVCGNAAQMCADVGDVKARIW